MYHEDHFHIVNACPEMPYAQDVFGKNRRTGEPNVSNYNVQDHTPPAMKDMVEFINATRVWMAEHDHNILAVHCKGGKGRTGAFICAWLLYSKTCKDARMPWRTLAWPAPT